MQSHVLKSNSDSFRGTMRDRLTLIEFLRIALKYGYILNIMNNHDTIESTSNTLETILEASKMLETRAGL